MIPLRRAVIENFRAVKRLELPLDPKMTVLVGKNGAGKTSVLDALAVGLAPVIRQFPGVKSIGFKKGDFLRSPPYVTRTSLIQGVAVSWAEIGPDAVAQGLSLARLEATLALFNLNCRRLQEARRDEVKKAVDEALLDYMNVMPDADIVDIRRQMAADILLPDPKTKSLPAFFSTLREYLEPESADVLADTLHHWLTTPAESPKIST